MNFLGRLLRAGAQHIAAHSPAHLLNLVARAGIGDAVVHRPGHRDTAGLGLRVRASRAQ